jgi:molybdopterin/thiamine biosynthesis adenylyltransferase
VLLVGCGAIGGHLAFELARSGILNLTVVDNDRLSPDNSFRHVLGREHWGQRKTEALRAKIEYQLLYTKVKAITDRIENAVRRGVINMAAYDVVVLATGNPTIELEINERMHTLENAPPAVFTWLEPLGIGGHALLTHSTPNRGCLQCLYTAVQDEEDGLANRAAFAKAGQSFGRDLSGCGNLHTPYGSVDAMQTATIATRLTLDALLGKEKDSSLVSWKGDDAAFREAGFQVSERYRASAVDLLQNRHDFSNPRCPICGSGMEVQIAS